MDHNSILLVYPITPTIKQIESALKLSSQNTQFIHITKLEQAAKAILNNSPSLIIMTDQKACINFIVSHRKNIQHASSKVMLISDKLLPDKLFNKLKIMGLIDNLLSHTTVKSILFKIQLHLKSLPPKDELKKRGNDPDKFIIKDHTEIIKDKPQVVKDHQYIIPSTFDVEDDQTWELLDVETKEIVDEFSKESEELLDKLQEIVDKFEKDSHNYSLLDEYGQIIDRMMGSSQTIGLKDFSTYCQMGKIIGYKASQSRNPVLLEIVSAVLADTVLLLRDLNTENKNGTTKIFKEDPKHKNFISRMTWLANKFRHLERASVSIVPEGESLEDLLAKL